MLAAMLCTNNNCSANLHTDTQYVSFARQCRQRPHIQDPGQQHARSPKSIEVHHRESSKCCRCDTCMRINCHLLYCGINSGGTNKCSRATRASQ